MLGRERLTRGTFHLADYDAHRGNRAYAIIVCIFASLGGFFIGYDQGVTGCVLVMESFLNDFCVGWHGQMLADCSRATERFPQRWVDYTLWYNMTYNIGCMKRNHLPFFSHQSVFSIKRLRAARRCKRHLTTFLRHKVTGSYARHQISNETDDILFTTNVTAEEDQGTDLD
ncbi:hypothetical protein PsorP6_010112 [Peronosclerospora sorghi]|uniref:Uncharacterized protein n=1 Tax=Peronosclerospora sorghi TaxID=230839 RepID=A0ACC0VW39_9STRA|nr:hypothetical protein PsorP6_010112 [Peronosclerospora sorghi]